MWYLRYHARKFFRSFTKPIDPKKAQKYLRISRLLYFLTGLTSLALVADIYFKNKENIDQHIGIHYYYYVCSIICSFVFFFGSFICEILK